MNKLTNSIIALPFLFLAAVSAYAALPVSTGTIRMEAELPREGKVEVGPVVYTIAPVEVKVAKPSVARAKAHKRVCDKRGHTVSVGMARMVQTVDKGDTGVSLCWTE